MMWKMSVCSRDCQTRKYIFLLFLEATEDILLGGLPLYVRRREYNADGGEKGDLEGVVMRWTMVRAAQI